MIRLPASPFFPIKGRVGESDDNVQLAYACVPHTITVGSSDGGSEAWPADAASQATGFRVQCLAMLLYISILTYWARLAASSWHSGGVSVATVGDTLVTANMLLLLGASWRGIHLALTKRFDRKWTKTNFGLPLCSTVSQKPDFAASWPLPSSCSSAAGHMR